jgi:hypothetical protein
MKVVYVAGPFTARDMWQVRKNVHCAEFWGFEIAEAGGVPLMPTSNTEHFYGTLTAKFWYDATMELLHRCDAIFMLPGWNLSKDARAEYDRAKELGLPIFHSADFVALEKWLAVDHD